MKNTVLLLFGFLIPLCAAYPAANELISDTTHQIEVAQLLFGPPTHEYPLDGEMTEKKLRCIPDNMKNEGINTILIAGGWGEKIYYLLEILKDPSKTDCYAMTFEMAAERNMQVALSGIYYTYLVR